MAPKNSKKNTKKGSDNEGDPGYAAKRARNNEVNIRKTKVDSQIVFKTNILFFRLCESLETNQRRKLPTR